ncbi:MAG: hypothetical protein JWO08_3399 [Verrucomicrobiaceae bacterium]|nr:hypothetical protein [Verrucomicrobiaceae bacterium]
MRQPLHFPAGDTLERARRYLAAMPPAISGGGGHAATFKVAVALVRGFALAETEALPLLMEWNATSAQPPWREADLRHKLRDAAKSPRAPGYLLDQHTAPLSHAADETEAALKARFRRQWPAFTSLTVDQRHALASLRRLPFAAVDMACKLGLLTGAQVDGHPSFILHQGRFAQARRLDGQPFARHDGEVFKAKTLCGSQGAFIGRHTLGPQAPVLLVEGCIGWLEALAALCLTDCLHWTVLAAVSAGSRFSRDPQLLQHLAGRRVRIVPDNDPQGQAAALTWAFELRAVRAQVDLCILPPEAKDIGDLLASPATLTLHYETLCHILAP